MLTHAARMTEIQRLSNGDFDYESFKFNFLKKNCVISTFIIDNLVQYNSDGSFQVIIKELET